MRRGMTPVVAIALLMGMTVAASGGAYAWVTTTTQQGMDEASASLNTELTVRSMRCTDTSAVVGISNTGDRELVADAASVFLFQDGELVDTMNKDLTGADMLRPGGFTEFEFPFTTYLEPGTRYTVEVSMADADYSFERTCQGQTGDLVGYWPFDTIDSRTVLDAAGDHDATFNNMTLNGTVEGTASDGTRGANTTAEGSDPAWTDGRFGDALRFDGSDDYVSLSDDGALNITGELTVTAWIYAREFPDYGSNRGPPILVKTGSPSQPYELGIDPTGPYLFATMEEPGGADHQLAGDTVLEPGRWYFVAVTDDLDTVKLYIDGEPETDEMSSSGWTRYGSGGDLRLGRGGSGAYFHGDHLFNGTIDDVRVYDQGLNEQEIQDIMAGGPPGKGISAYYPMDEGDGQTVYNRRFEADGRHGKAVRFDGEDDVVTVPDDPSLDITGELTVTAWVRRTAQTPQYPTIVQKGSRMYDFYLRSTDEVAFYCSGCNLHQTQDADIPADTWTHVAMVYDDAADRIRLYVGGDLEREVTETGSLSTDDGPLRIGDGPGKFNGSIDDVRIYDRSLSQSEIQDDMQGGPPKQGIVAYYSMDAPTGRTVWNDAFWQEGKHGGGLHLTEAAEHAVAPPTLGAVGGSSFSIALWADEHNDSGTNRMPVLFRISDADNEPRLTIQRDRRYVNDNDYIMFQLAEPDGSGITLRHGEVLGTGTPLEWENESGWHHVVGVRDAQEGEMRLYVDGTLQDSASDANISAGLDLGMNDTYLGNQIKKNQAFDGVLDGVRLYGSALSTEQVQALYNATR